jgi:hypothetical protein
VAAPGWLIVTRDSRIQHHRAEIAAVKGSRARMVVLAGDEARGTWQQLEILMRQWRATEACLGQPGPFIYSATRSSFRAVTLD